MKKSSVTSPAALRAALQAIQSGRMDFALAECMRILQRNPVQFDALSLAGQICLQQRRFSDAVHLLSKADSINSGDQRTVMALAQALRAGGRLTDAARCLETLCRSSAFKQEIYLAAANAWLDAACIGNALDLLLQAAAKVPRDHLILTRLAHVQRRDGQYESALVTLERLLEIKPDNWDACIEMAELSAFSGREKAAAEALERVCAVQDASPALRLRLALGLFRLGKQEACRQVLEFMLDDREHASSALALYIESCIVSGQVAALSKILQGPAALKADDPVYLIGLARASLVAGQSESALALAGKARRQGLNDYRVMGCVIECMDVIGSVDDRLAARLESYGYLVISAATQLGKPWLGLSLPRPRVAFLTSGDNKINVGDWRVLLTSQLSAVFDVYCYFSNPQETASQFKVRERIDRWRNVADLPDAELAALIRQDQVDILIDCDGHHHSSRLPVFCMKPAPLQLTLAGDTGTGMDCFDYRVILPGRPAADILPCVEPLLGANQPVVPELLPSLLLELRQRRRESLSDVSARQTQAPSFEQAFADSGWPAMEQAFRDRSDQMGLNGSRRFVRAAELVSMHDYCLREGLSYRVMEPAGKIGIGVPHFFGFPAPNPENTAIPEAYIAEVKEVVVFADNSLVLPPGHEALLDMALNGGAERFDFRSSSVSHVDGRSVFVSAPVAGDIVHIERGIFLGGQGADNYYHWLIEIMSRLAWVETCREYDGWPLLVNHVALQVPQHAEILGLINRSGREVIALLPFLPYSVGHLCVPSYLAWLPCHYRQGQQMKLTDQFMSDTAINYLRKQLLSEKSGYGCANGSRRLFISRRATAGYRHLLNEAELEALFVEFGFESIRPESLSVQAQIELFSQAEVIAGPTGAGMTNILFAPDHAKVICFMPRYLQEFASFSTIAAIRRLPMLFLDGAPVKGSHRVYFQSDYTVDLQQARDLLQEFCPRQEMIGESCSL